MHSELLQMLLSFLFCSCGVGCSVEAAAPDQHHLLLRPTVWHAHWREVHAQSEHWRVENRVKLRLHQPNVQYNHIAKTYICDSSSLHLHRQVSVECQVPAQQRCRAHLQCHASRDARQAAQAAEIHSGMEGPLLVL
jgi:hypothetical protein